MKTFKGHSIKENDYGRFCKIELTLSDTKPCKTYNINYELNGVVNIYDATHLQMFLAEYDVVLGQMTQVIIR